MSCRLQGLVWTRKECRFIIRCWFWLRSSQSCHCRGMLVTDLFIVSTGHKFSLLLLQQWEGADQVWDAVQVIVAMKGEWAVKPRGHKFTGHLVLSKVTGQGCMTCPTLYYSTIWGEPWTVQSAISNYRVVWPRKGVRCSSPKMFIDSFLRRISDPQFSVKALTFKPQFVGDSSPNII